MAEPIKACIDKVLPVERVVEAADRAMGERPANAPLRSPRREVPPPLQPFELALETAKEWRPGRVLRVGFLDGDPGVQAKVAEVARAWMQFANITFEFVDQPPADIRISFQDEGSWSYLGTDALGIAAGQPTMNYGWLTPDSEDEEYQRVVLHEFGHALACIHEHQNPDVEIPWDKEAVYRYYANPPNNWSRADVDHNLFEVYSRDSTQFSEFDRSSIMLYPVPEAHTIGTFSVGWNRQLSQTDKDFITSVYPAEEKPTADVQVGGPPVEASIGAHREEDLFRFSLSDPGAVALETAGPTDVVVAVYGPDSDTRLVAEDDDSGQGRNARIQTILMAGRYLVRVRHYSPRGRGAYQLEVRPAG